VPALPSDPALYDLVHVRPRRWDGGGPRTASLLRLDFDFDGASLTLDAAREQRRVLDRHGITALIVPARYRSASTSVTEAAMRAAEAARTAGRRGRFDVPRLHADHPMFFTFLVPSTEEDGPAMGQAAGRLIRVDKCDGHLWSDRETDEYFALIGPR